ncbi:hypothetical protein FXO37_16572 [Capsicum annuum]|nr:hypothetical protein FXO37_16572 [Capsicum annuum]
MEENKLTRIPSVTTSKPRIANLRIERLHHPNYSLEKLPQWQTGPSPLEGVLERVRAPLCSDPIAPRGAIYESGCLGMQPKSGGEFHPRLNTSERPIMNKYRGVVRASDVLQHLCTLDAGLWAPHSTRLETQTKDSDMCAIQCSSKPIRRKEDDWWDPPEGCITDRP